MDEKYKRISVLGKGSFGKAYLVLNTEVNQHCVVKQMETSMMEPRERTEAVKEALLLKRMDHPNIVRFQEVFMTRKGRLCIVMDYADGGDVHLRIKQQNGVLLPEQTILEWFAQICFALKHVHERKVLHRDLKTQNIFLMKTGQIKLGDFGIARVLDATKDYAKTMVGTPYYLSPEIIEDKPYNYKSDVWSSGVVLYEMTTLKHPFDADSLVILARQILNDQYPDPDPVYSEEMVSLIRTMLAKDAKLRPWIHEILQSPFLQGPMNHANVKYGLDLDLTPFTPKVEATPSSGGLIPAGDDGDGDDAKDAYDEDFEDYSGESDAEEEGAGPPGDLHKSVAALRLGPGGPAGSAPPPAPAADAPGATMGGSGSMSKIGAKADALREYLTGQMEAGQFASAYALMRESQDAVAPEEMQRRLADVLGAEKAQAFCQLFQLLCFLEDIAVSSPAGISRSSSA